MKKILVTGGTGLIGSHLIPFLQNQGMSVALLSRTSRKDQPSFLWDIENRTMDADAFKDTDTIIHLAGAGIADKRWTSSYKKKILESRVKGAGLLFEKLKSLPNSVKTFISASGVGYYGDSGDIWQEEDYNSKGDFMGETCKEWERSAKKIEELGIRVVILRIGIVLAREGGALPQIAMPIRYYAGAPFGDGQQFMSWIHINDLCRMFSFAITNDKMHGAYNAVAPGPVTNQYFIKEIASVLNRPMWPINIPSFIMKIILGEKSAVVLNGQRASSEKIRMAGFEFKHTDLHRSIEQLIT